MHLQIDHAGSIVDVKNLLPTFTAIGAFEQTALLAGAIKPSERADVDDVGILGMNDNSSDLKRLLETHVLPGLAAIGRFVDTVAVGHRVPRIVLPRPHPDNVG